MNNNHPVLAPLEFDEEFHKHRGAVATRIYVRARGIRTGRFDSVDIAYLTLGSLFRWMRSRGGENEWAESSLAITLGHPVDDVMARFSVMPTVVTDEASNT